VSIEYTIYVHPDGKMWAIGVDTRNGNWTTLWGSINKGRVVRGGDAFDVFCFSHAGNPKPNSGLTKKISEKINKGYKMERNGVYVLDKTLNKVTRLGGNILVLKQFSAQESGAFPDPIADPRSAKADKDDSIVDAIEVVRPPLVNENALGNMIGIYL
jgi:hypothetical protein